MTFRQFLLAQEGLMVADDKAEEGKSKVKNPPVRGPSSVTVSGVAGGPGGTPSGGAGGGPGAVPQPIKPAQNLKPGGK